MIRGTSRDVAVFVDLGLSTVRKVLVVEAGSEHDVVAVRLARRIAQNAGAFLTVLLVGDERRERVRQALVGVEAGTHEQVALGHVSPAEALAARRDAGYDVLVTSVGSPWRAEPAIDPDDALDAIGCSVVLVRAGVHTRPSEAAATHARYSTLKPPPAA